MLSRKILDVRTSLLLLETKITDKDAFSAFLSVCRSELADAADLAVELENTPMGREVMAEEAKRESSLVDTLVKIGVDAATNHKRMQS